VFDEAHNIDTVCTDALSIKLTQLTLETATRNINKLSHFIKETNQRNANKLRKEYDRLVEGIFAQSSLPIEDQIRPEPVLPEDAQALVEAMPGNMRRAEHFIGLLSRLIEYLKTRLRQPNAAQHRSAVFLRECRKATEIDPQHLQFCTSRLGSLLWSLEVSDIMDYTPVTLVADFATLISTYGKGFVLLTTPAPIGHSEAKKAATLHFACLDPSIAMEPILQKYRSVIITSGTLSPLNFYPKLLGFEPVISQDFEMSLRRPCVCPLVVTRGSDQLVMSSKHQIRNDPAVIRNYGYLLLEMVPHIPDGIVCFFPSYEYLAVVLSTWHEMELISGILKHKLLFIETTDALESSVALQHYRRACDCGRGAVMLCVARGKVSEGVDFDRHYGRGVIVYGIPYVYTEERTIKARLEYLRDEYNIKEADFLNFDAMRNSAQCVGRVIRGKDDYGVLIFADVRYSRMEKFNKLPRWIKNYLTPLQNNLSTDEAVLIVRKFLKEMAQPLHFDKQMDGGDLALWSIDNVLQQRMSRKGAHFQRIEEMEEETSVSQILWKQ
jgi:DNA excision repair protein ERCC-2